MRILDFFRDDTMFYVKLRRLVLPLAFQQFMLAAVSASDALMLGVLSQDSLSPGTVFSSLWACRGSSCPPHFGERTIVRSTHGPLAAPPACPLPRPRFS